jgi:phosphate starvation-inducible protein PhoH and related proteins
MNTACIFLQMVYIIGNLPFSHIFRVSPHISLVFLLNLYSISIYLCTARLPSFSSQNTLNALHKYSLYSSSLTKITSNFSTMKQAEENPFSNMMIDQPNTYRSKQDRKQEKKRIKTRNKKQQEQLLLREYLQQSTTPYSSNGLIPTMEEFGISNNYQNTPYDTYQHMSEKERAAFNKKFTTPRTVTQEQYTRLLKNHQKKIIVVNGPAGTGKTMFATEYGIRYFLTDVYEKLIFTRPSVSVDEDLGYLPGTLEEKMAPWIRPIYDVLYQFLTAKEIQTLIEDKKIEIAPLGYMRGRTFKNTWIIADEMQNSTIPQMKMLLTRIGENSRLVVTGDLQQHDKPYEINGLDDFLQRFKGSRSSSITSMEFERDDVQREEVVKEVLDIYARDELPEYYSGTEDYNIETTTDDSLTQDHYPPSSPNESVIEEPEQNEDFMIIEESPP